MKRRCQGQHGPRVPSRPAVREAPFLQVDGLPKGRHPGQFVDHNMQGRRIGHRRQEPVWTSECGAGVKAVSPAKRGRSGATRLDAGEHTRTLTVRRCLSATTTSGGRRKVRILHHDQCRVMTSGARRGRRRSGLRVSCACHNQSLARKVSREESALNRGVR